MQRLVLVRHGERLDTVDDSWCQSDPIPQDPPLTLLGLVQARCVGDRLVELGGVDLILASPFYRTIQTANEIAAAVGLQAEIELGLSECLYDKWFATNPLPTLRCNDPSYHHTVPTVSLATPRRPTHTPQYPESHEDVHQRYHHFTNKFLSSQDAQAGTTVLVGHGATVSELLQLLVKDQLTKKHGGVVAVGSITVLQQQNSQNWQLESYNDGRHLHTAVDRLVSRQPWPISRQLVNQWTAVAAKPRTLAATPTQADLTRIATYRKEKQEFLANLNPQQRAFLKTLTKHHKNQTKTNKQKQRNNT